MVTTAPGTPAPLASRTTPLMDPLDCASAGRAARANASAISHADFGRWNIGPLLSCLFRLRPNLGVRFLELLLIRPVTRVVKATAQGVRVARRRRHIQTAR